MHILEKAAALNCTLLFMVYDYIKYDYMVNNSYVTMSHLSIL